MLKRRVSFLVYERRSGDVEFAVGVGGADVAVAPRDEPTVDDAFARACASVARAELSADAPLQVPSRTLVSLEDREVARRVKLQERRRARDEAAVERERRARVGAELWAQVLESGHM